MTATATSEASKETPKDATASVVAQHAATLEALPFSDTARFRRCRARLYGHASSMRGSPTPQGRVVWSLEPYGFLAEEKAPATVNPSLWRQSRLNMQHGLFEVVPGVYQIRGLDIANMTLIEGDSGVIVVDTLTSIEGARAAMELYFKHRGRRPVAAVIFTHTHTDHWGGARGVLDEDRWRPARVPIIAPNLFMEHAVSENIIAGPAMLRRAQYQFGPFLAKGPRGQVDCGLGKSMAAGAVALLRPTDLIMATGDKRIIDGLEFEFQMAPNTEAPAEMHFYVPHYKLLNLAENCTHNFHNLLPFRGADVRDALAWSKYLRRGAAMWGGKAEAHVRPASLAGVGRGSASTRMIRQQRDLYKFAHDQTIRLMNHGLTATEIAETIKLPASLDGAWHTRGYYGHIRHNVKAIYQKYLGWYDANPVNLDPLPPVESGKKYVEYMGGADAILDRARKDFRERRIPFRGAGGQPSGVRRSRQRGRPRAARRHFRAARLCRGKCDLAQCLSVRRAGIAAGHAEGAAAPLDAARNARRAAHRPIMGRARRPPQRPQGRRQAHRAELEFYRHRTRSSC